MSHDTGILRSRDITPSLAAAWDSLPPMRGAQADFYDSHAWLATWCRVAGAGKEAALRIPAVLDDERPVALLPLLARSGRRWEAVGTSAVDTDRARYRPVLGAEQPDGEVLGLLVEQVAGAGVRELALNRLPSRDPATGAFLDALRQAGFAVQSRQRSSDCLAVVEDGWAGHRRRFGSYDRSVRTKANRLKSLWALDLEAYGPGTGRPVAEGFELYERLQRRSWKGPMSEQVRRERLELLGRTEALGWCRLYLLRLGGVPAAGHVWFRVGPVAIWLSTAYDQRLAAVSPGSILMWRAQEQLFAEGPLRLVDLLPGDNPQKDRLAPDRAPLLLVEAARRTLVAGATFGLRSQARYLGPRVLGRVRRQLAARTTAATPARQVAAGVRRVEVAPDGATPAATPLELDTAHRRALAVLTGHASPEAMAGSWQEDDRWWLVGPGPAAAVRVGAAGAAPVTVRELLLLPAGEVTVEQALARVAAAIGVPVVADLPAGEAGGAPGVPIPVSRSLLPWPAPAEAG
jgi:Acetyltransferase (GNAT) domain